jgi:adenylylsulfate kinase-like enzyme
VTDRPASTRKRLLTICNGGSTHGRCRPHRSRLVHLPFRAERQMARDLVQPGEFCEVYVSTPLAVAEQRNAKGLYKKARRGQLVNFTGIDSPYEPPDNPELRIDTTSTEPEQAADAVIAQLQRTGILTPKSAEPPE